MQEWIEVGSLKELQERKVKVVKGAQCPIAVFINGENIAAVDNRCPHMGFPLNRGSVRDGILTCHWHHARFDLCNGCAFDLFADDVPSFETLVRDGNVWVCNVPRQPLDLAAHRARLRRGLEHNLPLTQAKSLLGLLSDNATLDTFVEVVAEYGATHRMTWGPGLTWLTAAGNLWSHLDDETKMLATAQSVRQVAADCAGQPMRHQLPPVVGPLQDKSTFARWLAHWVQVRHRDGVERTLLEAVRRRLQSSELAALLTDAATERPFADGGHLLDFCNKACELLDIIGWEKADSILPLLASQLAASRGAEENTAWRHPHDLVALLQRSQTSLEEILSDRKAQENLPLEYLLQLSETILGDDTETIVSACLNALENGATPAQLAQAVARAAAWRNAHFASSNELGDWFTSMHTMTYANATWRLMERLGEKATAVHVRAALHGALQVYLDRFLNVPPAALPNPQMPPEENQSWQDAILSALDGRQGELASNLVAGAQQDGVPLPQLWRILAQATQREDLDFHATQMLEACLQQSLLWPSHEAIFLTATTRYLAAHCPTPRARLQTVQVAMRLHRGDAIYENDENRNSV